MLSVTAETIRRWAEVDVIPATRTGRNWRISKRGVERRLQANAYVPDTERGSGGPTVLVTGDVRYRLGGLYTVATFSAQTGEAQKTLYDWLRTGRIPYTRLGPRRYISSDVVEALQAATADRRSASRAADSPRTKPGKGGRNARRMKVARKEGRQRRKRRLGRAVYVDGEKLTMYRYPNSIWYLNVPERYIKCAATENPRLKATSRARMSLGLSDEKEAEAEVRRRILRYRSNLTGKKPDADPWKDITLADLFRTHREFCAGNGKTGGTVKRYRGAHRAFLRYYEAKLGKTLARDLTLIDLGGFIHFRMREDKYENGTLRECTYRTAFSDCIDVSAALNFAALPTVGLVKENPATGWKLTKPQEKEAEYFTGAEAEAVNTVAPPLERDWFEFIQNTGLRITEFTELRPQDIDLVGGWVRVREHEDGWRPKWGRPRDVKLFPKAREIAERKLAESGPGKKLFRDSKGRKLTQKKCLRALKRLCRKAGVKEKGNHALRHCFAYLASYYGASPYTIMKWMGHRKLETLLRYLHLPDDASEQAMQQVAQKWERDRERWRAEREIGLVNETSMAEEGHNAAEVDGAKVLRLARKSG